MNRIKKHHTVPCSYLRGFVNEVDSKDYRKSKIVVFDRNKAEFRVQPIDKTSVITDFYTVNDADGNKIDILEKALGDEVDSKIGHIITKVDNRELLSEDEKSDLFLFVAFQKARTESDVKGHKKAQEDLMKWMFTNKYRYGGTAVLKDTFEKIGMSMTDEEIQEHYDYIVEGQWDMQISNNGYIMTQMLNQVTLIYDFLIQFPHVIFKAPKNRYFITSDDPFHMTAPMEKRLMGGVGFLTPGLEIHIPLSKKSSLFFSNSNTLKISGYCNIPTKLLRAFNKRTCYDSYRFVLGNNEALISNIIKQTGTKGMRDFKQGISTPKSRSKKKKIQS